jgi:transcriptional regulator with XRE-family HTH domain
MSNPLRDFRSKWGISQEKMAFVLDVSTRTIARSEINKSLPRYSEKKFSNLVRVFNEFKGQDGNDIADWLVRPNEEFHNNRPSDLLGSYYATKVLLDKIRARP